jgi:hypothetical protein
MAGRLVLLLLACFLPGQAVVLDKIAIVVGNSIVKDSDIDRDVRITSFLNSQPLRITPEARKTSASRLIDQIFIRKEIELGDYPTAPLQQADQELAQLESQKFRSETAFHNGLRQYGITGPDLRFYFQWQLTILRFIDIRFRPAVLISDDAVAAYYKAHHAELAREHPGKASLDDVRQEIESTLTAQQVDKLLFAWLDDQRKETKIRYLEEGLQ